MALRRATESRRPDALFRDALAEAIADSLPDCAMPEEFWQAAREMADLSGDAVALRTRHFDDEIITAGRAGVRQIVTVGIGVDGRSRRLNLPRGVRFFDVDQAPALRAREALLELAPSTSKYPTASIAADVLEADVIGNLTAAGFDPNVPAVFVLEGLLYYLPREHTIRLVQALARASAPESIVLADHPAADPLAGPSAKPGATRDADDQRVVTAPFSAPDVFEPRTVFESSHWTLNLRTLTELAASSGRELPIEIDERRGGSRWWYITASRRWRS